MRLIFRSKQEAKTLAGKVKYSDAEMVSHLREGESDAFKAIYKSHFGMILNFVAKNSGNEADAEDIFQETVFILYNLVVKKDFELAVKLKTLIYSISRNLWLSELRKRGKGRERLKNYESYIMVDMSAHGNFLFAKEEAYIKIEKAFRILGEACQKILGLYYFHHKSMEQIAGIMEMANADTAKNQKYRCIQSIKRMM